MARSALFSDGRQDIGAKIAALYVLLAAANIGAWAWAYAAFAGRPVLMGTALLAYGFGLRHAFDADHIAAIDNVTRKLMQDGKRPIGVGLFFSLGHSTVVVAATIAVAATALAFGGAIERFQGLGSIIGTLVSAAFLFLIAALNIVILISVWRTFRHVLKGGALVEEDLNVLLAGRGFFTRIFRRLFRLIGKSWHMYPLGFLFGLGFDTATEIGLLGISAASAAKGMPVWSILVFPALFTAGMTLMDTTDSVLMLGAYGWAFVHPLRKLYYNLTITFVSVVVAVLIGGVEVLALLGQRFALTGAFWNAVAALSDNFGVLGYAIVGIFALSWIVSAAIYKFKRYDDLKLDSASF